MDQRQKELLTQAIPGLANILDSIKLAEQLEKHNLVSKQKIGEIMGKSGNLKSSFGRNLKLLYALQESTSSTAFDEFLEILNKTGNTEALEMISPTQPAKTSSKSILGKLCEKFSKSGSPKYPLGMLSGGTSMTARNPLPEVSTGAFCSFHLDSALSPLKEKHQATLISSAGSSTNTSPNLRCGDISCQIKRRNSETSAGNFQVIPPTPPLSTSHQGASTSTATPHNNNNSFRLRPNNTFACHSSQTPTRTQELDLINNLSLFEIQQEEQDEPIVCWHPYAQSVHSETSSAHSRSASPHYCYPSSESETSSSDSLIIDPNLILDSNVTMAIAREGTNLMAVKPAAFCHNNSEEDYKMTAKPRGPCLIVNNIDFEADIFPTRKGSDEDARRFDDIFQQLGFSVIMRRNQTADEMRKLFKDVAAECKPEHDALFVFILSHGSEHGIYGTDGMEVYLESEIISCFDNRNCKAMLGKPKVFVIQACRGRSKDCGGSDGDMLDSVAWPSTMSSPSVKAASQENRVPENWLPSSQPQDGKKRKHPIRTDMLLVFSCLAGFVSVRNELAGSWLGVALAYFIMTHAHERDLLRILNLVTNDVIQRESSHGHIQSIELKLLGWTKNLYFNPGIY